MTEWLGATELDQVPPINEVGGVDTIQTEPFYFRSLKFTEFDN